MKVLLKQDVDNLGYAGEVHTVANGYGRNYLLPQGLAVKATPNEMKQAEVWSKRAAARRAELRAEYETLSAQINDLTLTFTAKAGDTGKLYGSITTAQIADAMNEALGTEVDRRKVGAEPLRQLGEHQVVVRLSGDFQPELTVVIHPEGGLPTAAAQPAVDLVDSFEPAAEASAVVVDDELIVEAETLEEEESEEESNG